MKSDHARAVCAVGHGVARIFSTICYTHHGVFVYICTSYEGEVLIDMPLFTVCLVKCTQTFYTEVFDPKHVP